MSQLVVLLDVEVRIKMNNEKNKSVGFYFEDCTEIYMQDNKSIGYDKGFVAKNVKNLTAENNEAIKEINNQDFEQIKQAILSEIEDIIRAARQGGNSTKMQNLVQFLSSVGSTSLVEILKAQGILPRI